MPLAVLVGFIALCQFGCIRCRRLRNVEPAVEEEVQQESSIVREQKALEILGQIVHSLDDQSASEDADDESDYEKSDELEGSEELDESTPDKDLGEE